jgi:hypothetical protein
MTQSDCGLARRRHSLSRNPSSEGRRKMWQEERCRCIPHVAVHNALLVAPGASHPVRPGDAYGRGRHTRENPSPKKDCVTFEQGLDLGRAGTGTRGRHIWQMESIAANSGPRVCICTLQLAKPLVKVGNIDTFGDHGCGSLVNKIMYDATRGGDGSDRT